MELIKPLEIIPIIRIVSQSLNHQPMQVFIIIDDYFALLFVK